MVRKIISYFNKDLSFYESIKLVENQSNRDITGSCERYLKMCPIDEAPKCVARQIFIIGEFDDDNKNQSLICYEDPVLVVDCDEFLKVRFPRLYEDRERESSNN